MQYRYSSAGSGTVERVEKIVLIHTNQCFGPFPSNLELCRFLHCGDGNKDSLPFVRGGVGFEVTTLENWGEKGRNDCMLSV